MTPLPEAPETGDQLGTEGRQTVARELIRPLIWGGLLFLSAGRLDWPSGWLLLGLTYAVLIPALIYLVRHNPAVVKARRRMGPGTEPFDKVFLALWVSSGLGLMVLCALDAGRFGWSQMPLGLQALGTVMLLAGMVVIYWSMAVNRFFEVSVRLQSDRDHQVCRDGPYRFVRHPGYSGALLGNFAMPLVLGSWWGLLPALAIGVLSVVRTLLEERTLKAKLEGYEDFTRETRYRLVPGVW